MVFKQGASGLGYYPDSALQGVDAVKPAAQAQAAAQDDLDDLD